jgi:F420-dependent oxidoreductase-like protein
VRLASPCLVVLVGPSGSGKSTWAQRWFRADQVVSTDQLRALVGEGEHDQRAGTDAFALLDDVLERRLKRRLVTVVDSLGLDPDKRQQWLALATKHGVPAHAVMFDTSAEVCRARNKARGNPVPPKVVTNQLAAFAEQQLVIGGEGFASVEGPDAVRIVPPALVDAPEHAARQQTSPVRLSFGLQVPSFSWTGGGAELRDRLAAVARAAEHAGFESLWVMDHFVQIPFVGREWEDMLESYTTLGFLAGVTERIRLGTLVTGVTYRNLAHLGKIVATLDVLSGGRANCGIGAAWFEREHRAYGYPFPPVAERYALLEDALELLPLMWGAGAPAYKGRTIEVAEAICYPRPLQARIPIMVGGSGEKRTLRLVARYADACNLFGDPATVAHKIEVLHRHCADVGRDPAEITVTHLATALADPAAVERLKPANATPESFAVRVNAGTIDDQIGHCRALADAGVQTAIVSLPDLDDARPVERFGEVIAAFAV